MNELQQYLKDHPYQRFNPIPHYNVEGDFISCYVTDENCYAKDLNKQVTVYYSMITHEVVGIKIYCIKELMKG